MYVIFYGFREINIMDNLSDLKRYLKCKHQLSAKSCYDISIDLFRWPIQYNEYFSSVT